MSEDNNKKLWFKRKRYGWGWQPVTWEGWAMTIGYIVALFVLFTYDVPDDGSFPFDRLVIFGLFLILFFRIIWLKGEKPPKWQWGRKKEDDQARPPSEKTYT